MPGDLSGTEGTTKMSKRRCSSSTGFEFSEGRAGGGWEVA